jgi:hypothetical protein
MNSSSESLTKTANDGSFSQSRQHCVRQMGFTFINRIQFGVVLVDHRMGRLPAFDGDFAGSGFDRPDLGFGA